jgi:DNA polymerase iota
VARQYGVPKMVSIAEARRRCPDIVLINGEDLTPYRAASKRIMNVLRQFGTLERSGLDECGLDITSETMKRAALGVF